MNEIQDWDDRRCLMIPGNAEETIQFATEHWIHTAKRSIQQRGRFAVALSGGSTPKAIYEKVTSSDLDWGKVWLFWGDERAVPADHPDSNYRMAMESGFKNVPIPPEQIFRMKALEKQASEYEELIHRHLGKHGFDLVMLGLGEDGHTASLFPHTEALLVENKWVVSNLVPQLKTHRMTLTFPCINQSHQAAFYVIGANKQEMVSQVLNAAILSPWPASRIGTPQNKALWILDQAAGSKRLSTM